ncbi:hypothetical protein F4808DRAFT_430999 [Astrocystis sublimbata]|nr:hypothetical protein F4808DRAFT_430999 [Astrocystis sublimbata]
MLCALSSLSLLLFRNLPAPDAAAAAATNCQADQGQRLSAAATGGQMSQPPRPGYSGVFVCPCRWMSPYPDSDYNTSFLLASLANVGQAKPGSEDGWGRYAVLSRTGRLRCPIQLGLQLVYWSSFPPLLQPPHSSCLLCPVLSPVACRLSSCQYCAAAQDLSAL